MRISVAAGVTGAAIATPLIGATSASAASVSTWDEVAMCESTGNWSINTGNGFYGGLQFTNSTWREFGGTQYAQRADLATKDQQIAIAEKVLAGQGPGAWPTCSVTAGLTGNGGAPAINPRGPVHGAKLIEDSPAPRYPRSRTEPAASPGGSSVHTVVEGDTLFRIARAHGVGGGWQELHRLNHHVVGQNPHLIHAGQKLALGVGGSPAALAKPVAAKLTPDAPRTAPPRPVNRPQVYADRVPQKSPVTVQTAIAWALRQLGAPYQWGGTCTNPHGPDRMERCDCSSLVQKAYAAAGVTLPRTTYTQVFRGRAVDVGALKPGDLLFTNGSARAPGHVGMFIGGGRVIHAPRTGDMVRIASLADWEPRILAVRRIVG